MVKLCIPSLSPASLPIRLLQSSQPDNDHRRRCFESTAEKCELIPEPTIMARCVTYDIIFCIDRSHILASLQKVAPTAKQCEQKCFKGLKFAEPHHAKCLLDCLSWII